MLTVTTVFDPETRVLSYKEGSDRWAGTTEDNRSAQIVVEGIEALLNEYTAELVFGIPMYNNGVIYHPIGQIDAETQTYVLPNAILASARDGILPTELRLTKDSKVITSRNRLEISVVTAIDALRPFDGAYLPDILGRSQEWAPDVQYAKGAIVIRDEVLYYSGRADNLGHDPKDGNISWWGEVSIVAIREYQTYIGDGVATQFTIAHHMQSPDLQFTVTHNGVDKTGDVTDMAMIDENNAVFTFSSPPQADTLLRINKAYRAINSPMWVWGMLESEEGMVAPEALFGVLEITDEKVTVRNGELGVNSSGRAYAGPEGLTKVLANEEDLEAHIIRTDNPHSVTKEQLGLQNVDPTSDLNKPISIATQTALNLKANSSDLTAHTGNTSNPHSVTKAQVGLGNVDNTSDANKPVSTATNTELAKKVAIAQGSGNASKFALTDASGNLNTFRTLTDTDIPNLNASKITAGTLEDARIPTTIARSAEVTAHTGRTDNPHAVTKEQVGLEFVDNTADADKPISTATQTALDGKAEKASTESHINNKSNPHSVTKAQVGLSNVDNTSDLDKPISTATQTALDGTVKKTGNESIAGIKSFSDNVEIGTTQVPKQLSIKGNLLIDGNITQNGSAYETHAQQVYTTDDKIIMRDGATAGLLAGETSGLTFNKYDGTNNGELSVDSAGTARVGDVGNLQPLATRDEAELMTNNQPVVWDSNNLKLVTRALVAGDIPDLDAGKIKSGTIADERIPSGITRDTELTAHTSRTDNPHSVTKSQVDLGNVDNTSDINKPISTATQTALDGKQDKLTFDDEPVAGSDNVVKSGGIYDALQAIDVDVTVESVEGLPEALSEKLDVVVYNGDQASLMSLLNQTVDDVTDQITALGGELYTLSTEKLSKSDIKRNLHNGDITLTREDTSVKASMSGFNPYNGVGGQISFIIPGASSTLSGVMTANHVQDIEDLKNNVTVLSNEKEDKLTFDESPTADSDNPVKSGGIYTALAGKQATLTFDNAPVSGSANPVKSGGIYNTLATKQDTITGGATTISSSNLTASRALVSNGSGKVAVSDVTSTELGYLDGVTSAVQTQLNGKADAVGLRLHRINTTNPHSVTKKQVGLEFADNTADVDKPISTATQTALNLKANSSDLTAHTGNTSNPHSVTKAQVGLGNVDNTSDANKPVSTATQTALNGKVTANNAITAGTKAKITYDAKGLVTAGADLVADDIPGLPASKINSGTFEDARIPTLAISKTTGLQAALDAKIPTDAKGSPNGVAELGADGKVLSGQLPSYVDDVLEYDNLAGFPTPGEAGKIYVAIDANKTYRWSGTGYVEISPSLALGTTSSTALRGDWGAQAYNHITDVSNPHGVTKAQVGLSAVANELQYSASNPPPYPVTSVAGKTGAVVLAEADIPALSAGKITSGTFADARIPDLDADKIVSGIFADARIPALEISKITGLQTAISSKVTANAGIAGGTKTKITYDSKGLVTAGADLTDTDIPSLAISKITGLQTALDGKVASNTPITAGTKTKITYDAKGLVTAGANLVASDIPALDSAKITTGTFVDARIPSLNASKITAGTFADARIPTTVERIANKVTAWQTTPTDTAYPTEKLVKDSLDSAIQSAIYDAWNEEI